MGSKEDATNACGRAGGVRKTVGVATGVFVGRGVEAACVCCMEANAVCTATVICALMSTGGVEG